MNTTFVQQNQSDRLLLFFHGWGMDPGIFQHWEQAGFDVLVAWDYRQLTALPPLARYREIRLLAWSLGVWVAAVTELPPLSQAIAVNGTLQPIDPESGIQPEIFQGTIDHWLDEQARERFQQRVIGPKSAGRNSRRTETSGMGFLRQPEDQRDELLALQHYISKEPVAGNIYQRALISGRDRIFSPEIQRRFWKNLGIPCIARPDAAHFPFAEIRSWQELWHLE
ncbi:MAG: DUF452 family protein [Lentisphaeria bacterium]|nr:DUF452 family protein [Lentisphaeria bacterium]